MLIKFSYCFCYLVIKYLLNFYYVLGVVCGIKMRNKINWFFFLKKFMEQEEYDLGIVKINLYIIQSKFLWFV